MDEHILIGCFGAIFGLVSRHFILSIPDYKKNTGLRIGLIVSDINMSLGIGLLSAKIMLGFV